jgi:CBS domain-containing protein
MRCEEIMKKNIECVAEDDTALDAAQTMRDENIGFLPVCEEDMGPVGTLTDRDLAIRVCAEDRVPSKTKVGEVMSREVIACSPADDISDAQRLMAQHHKSRILVCDESKRLVGVISLSDIIEYEATAGAETLREVSSREVGSRVARPNG